jgi:hypothetical protein
MKKFTIGKRMKTALLGAFLALSSAGAAFAQPVSSLVVGTGTAAMGSPPIPYYTGWWGSKNQYLVLASELTALGAVAGDIAGIGFEVTTASGLPMTNFEVKIGMTTATALTTTWVTTGLTSVYTIATLNPVANSLNTHPFNAPFYWDGVSNIVIETCFNNSSWSGSHNVVYSTTSFASSHTYYADIGTVCSAPGAGYTYTQRPNIHMEFIVPPDNAGVTAITNPANNVFCSGPQVVKANIHNFGSNIINNVTVNWSVNGITQPSVAFTGPIDMENTPAGPDAEVILGTVNFPFGVDQNVRVWTTMPNGVADTDPDNDSLTVVRNAELLGINDFLISPQDTTICEGDLLVLDAGEHPKNPIYIWSNGTLEQQLNTSTGGTFWVKVQNTDGCVARDTITVTLHPDPVANSIAIVDNGDGTFTFNIIGAQNVDNYVWNFGNGETRTGPGPHVIPYADGVYDASVVLSNQCGELTLTRVITAVGIDDLAKLGRELQVYPNPGSDVVTIRPKGDVVIKELTMFNLLGQKVHHAVVKGNQYEMNVKGFAAGMYSIMIETNKGTATKKLEIVR